MFEILKFFPYVNTYEEDLEWNITKSVNTWDLSNCWYCWTGVQRKTHRLKFRILKEIRFPYSSKIALQGPLLCHVNWKNI